MARDKSDILQGTLDLMVLQTLETQGTLHGYGIARRIEQVSEDALKVHEGTLYASLLRLLANDWVRSEWGLSDNNRRAKFYSITRAGRKQLASETENWERISAVMDAQADAMMREVSAVAAQVPATPAMPNLAASGDLPAGSVVRYSFVSSSNGGATCSRSMQVVSAGNGAQPQVKSSQSGDCSKMGLASPRSVSAPAAPAAPRAPLPVSAPKPPVPPAVPANTI